MAAQIFPPGFPTELVADAFKAGSEVAWPPQSAPKVVEWLRQNGFAVLGTELWMVRGDGIQPGIYVNGIREIHGNAVSHMQKNEGWQEYVTRSAKETLRYLNSFTTPIEARQQGDVFFNIVWASESDDVNLRHLSPSVFGHSRTEKFQSMKRATWVVFLILQILGLVCARFGALESESALRRSLMVCSWVLLLPGNIPAALIDEPNLKFMMHFPILAEWLIFGAVAVAINAFVWVSIARFWSKRRRQLKPI